MPYRFRKKDRSIAHATRRIAREQVDRAIAAIDNIPDPAEAAREVRRCTRRLLALIALIESGFADAAREIRFFEQINRELARSSDIVAIHLTFRKLSELIGRSDAGGSERVSVEFASPDDAASLAQELGRVQDRLIKARRRIRKWDIGDVPWPAFASALEAGRAQFETCQESGMLVGAADEMHRARQVVRLRMTQMRLFRAYSAGDFGRYLETLRRLSDNLGSLRDLTLFSLSFRQSPEDFGAKPTIETIHTLLAREMTLVRERVRSDAGKIAAFDFSTLLGAMGSESTEERVFA